jgi:hypothetical protein
LEGELTFPRGTAGSRVVSRGLGGTLSDHLRRALVVLAVGVVIALPIWRVVQIAPRSFFPGHFGVFGEMMNSIETIVFPLLIVLVTCLGFYRAVVARHVANTRSRIGIRRYLARRLAAAAGGAAALFFLQTLISFIVAYYVWPALGDPSLYPEMSTAQATVASYTDFAFGVFIRPGEQFFGIGYSLWVALAAAAYAALTICLLVTISNRILALAAPFLLYVASDLTFALAWTPQLSFRSSTFPMGLSGSDPLFAAAPNLVLILVVAAFVWYVIRHAPTNPRLS